MHQHDLDSHVLKTYIGSEYHQAATDKPSQVQKKVKTMNKQRSGTNQVVKHLAHCLASQSGLLATKEKHHEKSDSDSQEDTSCSHAMEGGVDRP
mmetsp:Transcript_63515/g.139170  ORF Transcript_63515/g.139170 Transcript_63515/m.139170 type:complete len:94 (-) Transcript_63515:661-942(-)